MYKKDSQIKSNSWFAIEIFKTIPKLKSVLVFKKKPNKKYLKQKGKR